MISCRYRLHYRFVYCYRIAKLIRRDSVHVRILNKSYFLKMKIVIGCILLKTRQIIMQSKFRDVRHKIIRESFRDASFVPSAKNNNDLIFLSKRNVCISFSFIT